MLLKWSSRGGGCVHPVFHGFGWTWFGSWQLSANALLFLSQLLGVRKSNRDGWFLPPAHQGDARHLPRNSCLWRIFLKQCWTCTTADIKTHTKIPSQLRVVVFYELVTTSTLHTAACTPGSEYPSSSLGVWIHDKVPGSYLALPDRSKCCFVSWWPCRCEFTSECI